MLSRTKEDFLFEVEAQLPFEFTYKGKKYNMTYDTAPDGHRTLVFGQLYEEKHYDSVEEFLNTCRIENHFFKDMMDII